MQRSLKKGPLSLIDFIHPFLNSKLAGGVLTVLFFTGAGAVLVSRAVGIGLSHDEYQFIAGGQLFRDGHLLPYLNYPFLHMPYMPFVYGVALFLRQNDLLLARLVNEGCIFLSLAFLFAIAVKGFEKHPAVVRVLFGAVAALLFLTNASLEDMDGRALNHALPILLCLIAVWLYTRLSVKQPKGKPVFLCGSLIGLALGTHLNFAVVLFPLLLAIFFDPVFAGGKDKIKALFTCGLGGFVALLPAGILFLLAPQQFIYGNFVYIRLNTVYRQTLGYATSMNIPDKLSYFIHQVFSSPDNLLLYTASLILFIAVFILWRKARDREFFLTVFLFLFGGALFISAFSPTPLWPQYFADGVPFLIAGLFAGIPRFFNKRPVFLLLSLVTIFVFLFIGQTLPALVDQVNLLNSPHEWVTSQYQELGSEIRSQANCRQNCKVLTLAPILPLGAGLDTYPIFTVGPFSWRTAQFLSPQRRSEYRVISPDELTGYLYGDPPDAILTGMEANNDGFTSLDPGGLEQPLNDYAQENGYRAVMIENPFGSPAPTLTLWVK